MQKTVSEELKRGIFFILQFGRQVDGGQTWASATSKVAPLPLLALKSSVATATCYSSSKVARYRYFTKKVAALPATATLKNE